MSELLSEGQIYGLLFSMERGNMDIYAFFFFVIALWLMIKRTGGVWLPALFVSMATHMKLYPTIPFALLFWKFRLKSILPIILLNLLLFFSTGYKHALEFIEAIISYTSSPFIWVGNHSAASFGFYVNRYLADFLNLSIPPILFYLLPLAILGAGCYTL